MKSPNNRSASGSPAGIGQISRRTLVRVFGAIGVFGVPATAGQPAVAATDETALSDGVELVHEQRWSPTRPDIPEQIHEQLWLPERPEFSMSPVHVETWVDSPTIQDYADEESGRIEQDGLSEAFSDWQEGTIEAELLSEVANAWQTGDPV